MLLSTASATLSVAAVGRRQARGCAEGAAPPPLRASVPTSPGSCPYAPQSDCAYDHHMPALLFRQPFHLWQVARREIWSHKLHSPPPRESCRDPRAMRQTKRGYRLVLRTQPFLPVAECSRSDAANLLKRRLGEGCASYKWPCRVRPSRCTECSAAAHGGAPNGFSYPWHFATSRVAVKVH